MSDPTRYDPSRAELADLLGGEPSYRVGQVWEGLYRDLRDPLDITNVGKELRAAIDEVLPLALTEVRKSVSRDGETVKFLWQLRDGHLVETVLMHYAKRTTVCVSSQAGCAMGCGFCATGQAGFDRHLSIGEIVEQVVRVAQHAAPRRVDNVVFMGMGEPLANFEPVSGAIHRIHDDIGIGARHITVSTIGIVPGIAQFAALKLQVGLAVSLHAATDAKRNRLVPINKTYPLAPLARACHDYMRSSNRRISFEWAMIAGTNDSPRDAEELADYARPLRAHVNLIPLNPTPGWPTIGSSPEVVDRFRTYLEDLGVNATVRRNRGTDINAACGQLKADQVVDVGSRRRSSKRPRR